ncbi:hypothetical protein QJS66_22510 [Kocuria rhizophila]|nr:hypothetical protein QJS66_22510 [Kocuria rhizophila]
MIEAAGPPSTPGQPAGQAARQDPGPHVSQRRTADHATVYVTAGRPADQLHQRPARLADLSDAVIPEDTCTGPRCTGEGGGRLQRQRPWPRPRTSRSRPPWTTWYRTPPRSASTPWRGRRQGKLRAGDELVSADQPVTSLGAALAPGRGGLQGADATRAPDRATATEHVELTRGEDGTSWQLGAYSSRATTSPWTWEFQLGSSGGPARAMRRSPSDHRGSRPRIDGPAHRRTHHHRGRRRGPIGGIRQSRGRPTPGPRTSARPSTCSEVTGHVPEGTVRLVEVATLGEVVNAVEQAAAVTSPGSPSRERGALLALKCPACGSTTP